MQAIVKVESPVKVKLPTKISGFKIHHLPVGAHAKWRQGFVTTFAAYIGTKSSPWDLKDKETLDAMQNCWNHVYQTTAAAQHRISGFHDVVFVLVGTLAFDKYRLMGPIGRPKVERASKHDCQHRRPSPR